MYLNQGRDQFNYLEVFRPTVTSFDNYVKYNFDEYL